MKLDQKWQFRIKAPQLSFRQKGQTREIACFAGLSGKKTWSSELRLKKWQISGWELKKSSTASSVWDSELQGFGKNEILGVPLKRIAKYDVFWKWLNFKHFLGSQLEAPQFLRDTRKKDRVFYIFAISQSRAPRNLDKKWQFRMEAPGF